ncbi:hypothetical protein J6590_045029 [Homalodisca vitripennis]|nr:hypothetical protein J6590_045029 [Homalodisca vitripennis]
MAEETLSTNPMKMLIPGKPLSSKEASKNTTGRMVLGDNLSCNTVLRYIPPDHPPQFTSAFTSPFFSTDIMFKVTLFKVVDLISVKSWCGQDLALCAIPPSNKRRSKENKLNLPT